MSIQKSVIGIIIAFVLSNILTTLWYMVTDDANMVPYRREEMNYLGLILNHAIYAILFVHLLSAYLQKHSGMIHGFLGGSLLATMMFLPSALVVRSIWVVDFNGIFLLNTIAHILIGGIMGVAVTYVFNFKKQSI